LRAEHAVHRIIWLASYPKSGNTWFRVFLSNLLQSRDQPIDINAILDTPLASSRQLFDQYSGVAAADLTMDEIETLRPRVYEALSLAAQDCVYHKIHDALTVTDQGSLLVSEQATRAAVYLIRNPLDVAVSFAHHSSISMDASIAALNDPTYSFASAPGKLHAQLRQKLSTWSGHVRSWLEQAAFPVHVIRYEDMHREALATFRAATRFLQLSAGDEQIRKAIAFSEFSTLHRQEAAGGFRELKAPRAATFFRKGVIGSWRDELTAAQVKRVISQHRDVMQAHGYLDEC